jgi:pyrroline-5-carboxylate reductase
MTTQTNQPRIGFVGAGRMATALAKGIVSSGFAPATAIAGSDVAAAALEAFVKESGGRQVSTNAELARTSHVLILAVKPQQADLLAAELLDQVGAQHLIISVMAGVTLARLSSLLPKATRVVRVMPNTPALVGCGASGYAMGAGTSQADAEYVEGLLSTVGLAIRLPEHLLDAVTGLSGSGPAYVFQMIEALSDGGVQAGLPRDVATRLAAQTMLGAAKMVLETGQHPAALKDAVTSPGGTTIAGLAAMESGRVRAALINAVMAATARSKELGK